LTACGLKKSDKIGNWGELYKKKKITRKLKTTNTFKYEKKMYKKFGNLVIKKS
jgi:hypothetical protein